MGVIVIKRLLMLFATVLLLTACGNDEKEPKETVVSPLEEQEGKGIDEVSDEANEETDEVDADVTEADGAEDGKLNEVGQKIVNEDAGVTVELMAIKNVNDTIDLDPVKLTIKDIKIIRMSDVKNQDLLYSIGQYTNKEEFDYIQIQYEIENTKDINVRLNSPIEAVVLSTGEQIISFEKDFNEDPNFAKTLYGKVINESMVTLIIEQSDPSNIEEIKIVTGRIDDADSSSTLVDEKTTVYEIE